MFVVPHVRTTTTTPPHPIPHHTSPPPPSPLLTRSTPPSTTARHGTAQHSTAQHSTAQHTTTTTPVAILARLAMSVRDPSYSSKRLWKVSGLCGPLGKMAIGVDVGAHGNGIFCLSCLGVSPSLLSGKVVLMFALALLLSLLHFPCLAA